MILLPVLYRRETKHYLSITAISTPSCLPCSSITLRQGRSKEQQNVAFTTGIEETFYMGEDSSEHSANL